MKTLQKKNDYSIIFAHEHLMELCLVICLNFSKKWLKVLKILENILRLQKKVLSVLCNKMYTSRLKLKRP